jgi:cob(I)alamin adenosyltransferase
MADHSKIYTKSGDQGETSLVDGTRVSKDNPRIDLYGDTDELNSLIGKAATSLAMHSGRDQEIQLLQQIQAELFNLGSMLACPEEQQSKYQLATTSLAAVELLETEIDRIDQMLPPLKNFILPGGVAAACDLHICRAVTRRVERKLIGFTCQLTDSSIYQNAEIFINRLSDYLFVLARSVNHQIGIEEIIWQKAE